MTANSPKATDLPCALLAEDDSLIRELVSNYLERLGFSVKEASNGKAALDLLENVPPEHFDLVVTDILMPKVNGDQLIEAAREKRRCERFLVMSGNILEYTKQLNAGQNDSEFLEKPFTFSDFESKLSSLYEEAI